jgi:hypothetical protein
LNNPHVASGLSSENVKWAFTSSHGGFWIPLTWLSFMVDSQLQGLNAGFYHVTNLVFHIFNTLLLFLVFRRMTGDIWRSGFVAALFAVHPVHVESVAWVSERKDLLFAFFWILTMWSYHRYASKPGPRRYAVVVFLFIAGLMSKPMIVTLPFVLLLLDYWPLNRFQSKTHQRPGEERPFKTTRNIVLEKVPLLLLSVGASALTFVLQRAHGAVSSIESAPILERILQVPLSYAKYMINMLWPQDLTAVYPYTPDTPVWQITASFLLLGSISWLAVSQLNKRPYLVVGWLWFLGTLVPVIGLIKIGSHAIADRYTYMTFVGLYIMIAWGVPDILGQFRHKRTALASTAIAVMLIFVMMAKNQTRHWINSVQLFSHAIQVNPNTFLAHRNLGLALSVRGDLDQAAAHFKEALRINPGSAKCYNDLGTVFLIQGRLADSMVFFEKALQYWPDYPKAHNNLGLVLMAQKQYAAAATHFRAALKTSPNFKRARKNLQKSIAAMASN